MTQTQSSFPRKLRRAFTLTEVMIAFALISMATAVIFPHFSGMLREHREREATAKAALIDLAKAAYIREHGQAAFTHWLAASSDNDRFLMVKDQLGPGCTAASLSDYAPSGYSFILNGLDAGVTVTGPNGIVHY